MKRIDYFINHYKKDPTLKVGIINREKYYDMMKEIFSKYKVPFELSYIAFVESNYEETAYNPVSGAKGMWQLMSDTAVHYGLKVNNKSDERTDPEKINRSVSQIFKGLISMFGNDQITLIIAAFNCGDGT